MGMLEQVTALGKLQEVPARFLETDVRQLGSLLRVSVFLGWLQGELKAIPAHFESKPSVHQKKEPLGVVSL